MPDGNKGRLIGSEGYFIGSSVCANNDAICHTYDYTIGSESWVKDRGSQGRGPCGIAVRWVLTFL